MKTEKMTVAIHTEWIPLDKLLKFAGVVETGGQAGELIAEGLIRVNQAPVHEKRKKIRPGDVVAIGNEVILTISQEEAQ